MTGGERAAVVAEALDTFEAQHEYPTETDDGLVMRCRCGTTPPSHLLGQQVDEALWLWQHCRTEQIEVVVAALDAQPGDAEQAGGLTDEERKSLRDAVADGRVADSHAKHGVPAEPRLLDRVLRAECEWFVDHLAPAVERIIAARIAAAQGAAVREVRAAADTGGERGAGG